MPEYHCASARDAHENVVSVRIFAVVCQLTAVVSWTLPEPGLRTFTPLMPGDAVLEALHFAGAQAENAIAQRVVVTLEDELVWETAWGRLAEPAPN